MVMFPFDVPRLLLALNQTYSNMYQYIIVSQALLRFELRCVSRVVLI